MRIVSGVLLTLICTAVSFAADDRSVIKAYKTDSQPTIDGEFDEGEWDAAGPWINVTMDSPNAQLGDQVADDDVFGGDEDLSYRFRVMWEEDTFNFFVAYEITDDIAATEQPRDDRNWERDQVETFIDGTSIDGDADGDSFFWWNNIETYGKFGVSRDSLFEGHSDRMTDDQELWADGFDTVAPLLAVGAAGETGENGNYIVELGITLEGMWEDSVNAPFLDTPTDDSFAIVEDSTRVKFTVALSDDDDFDFETTDRSHDLTYYRELDGEPGNWNESTHFADLVFTGEFDGTLVEPVAGDCNGDGSLTTADLSCQTSDTIDGTLESLNLIVGDFDADGSVAFLDFLALANNFGQEGNYTQGDADASGTVDFLDFLALANNFGQSSAEAAAVPEPSSLMLFGFSGLLLVLRRRR